VIVQGVPKIKWNSSYLIGNAVIDKQHEHLVSLINSLGRNIEIYGNGNNNEFHALLYKLMQYTQTHFTYEENEFRKFDKPISHHKALHDEFIEYFAEYCTDATHGIIDKPGLHKYLVNWLNNHILVEDMEYQPYINQQLTKTADFG
jgi:hemerythrin